MYRLTIFLLNDSLIFSLMPFCLLVLSGLLQHSGMQYRVTIMIAMECLSASDGFSEMMRTIIL